MNYQIASVFLKDGKRFDHVVIVGGFITTIDESNDIPFTEEDIDKIVVNHGKWLRQANRPLFAFAAEELNRGDAETRRKTQRKAN